MVTRIKNKMKAVYVMKGAAQFGSCKFRQIQENGNVRLKQSKNRKGEENKVGKLNTAMS